MQLNHNPPFKRLSDKTTDGEINRQKKQEESKLWSFAEKM